MASIETFPDGRVPAIVPWYRQMWPWLLMLMPAIALVGGLITYYLAATTNNALVADDYYKQGKAINLDIARDKIAAENGLSAILSDEGGALTVRLTSSTGYALPAELRLRLMHPTLAEMDRDTAMPKVAEGLYRQPGLTLPAGSRWRVQIEDAGGTWRLVAAHAEFGQAVVLKAVQ
jgi:hypothetical protein